MAGAIKRRGDAEDQTALDLGERSEQSSTSWELAITSVHKSRFGDHVIIGRDESDQLRRALVLAKRSPRDPAIGETWRVTGQIRPHPEFGPQLHADVALPWSPEAGRLSGIWRQTSAFPVSVGRRRTGFGLHSAKPSMTAFGIAS